MGLLFPILLWSLAVLWDSTPRLKCLQSLVSFRCLQWNMVWCQHICFLWRRSLPTPTSCCVKVWPRGAFLPALHCILGESRRVLCAVCSKGRLMGRFLHEEREYHTLVPDASEHAAKWQLDVSWRWHCGCCLVVMRRNFAFRLCRLCLWIKLRIPSHSCSFIFLRTYR